MISLGARDWVSRPSRGFFASKWRLVTDNRLVLQLSVAIIILAGIWTEYLELDRQRPVVRDSVDRLDLGRDDIH